MNETKDQKTRAPYVKPLMERVELVPQEAVLATCKYNNGNDATCGPDPDCIVTQRS